MIIIDSLLQFNFFLSGEVQENLSLFSNGFKRSRRQQCRSGPEHTASTRRTVD